MTARPYHHGGLREALLEGAVREIEVRGVDGLSVRGLARDLGVSHGASARHFRDRAALLDAVAVEGFGQLLEAMRAGGSDELLTAAHGYVRFAVDHPRLLAATFAAKRAQTPSEELLAAGERAYDFVVELLVRGQGEGRVRPGDPRAQARVTFAAVHGVAMLAVDDLLDGAPWEQATDEIIELLSAGLGSPSQATTVPSTTRD
ncbi:TetR/AcrR family transcriptional regulator [Ruania alkalisoli]|uniref:TetR/AcrR family transcriptional regulator n=1 Tax=Ruania alkalisoli TaxID=2779775 RepID=A0A7M1SUK3_9MICO|nr:TetR/AcrR family transcriptional regulator [Ruania alkalisoli]QOR70614.1 TetR/AcrR family transcriptional regulator [Ruania alkalisoli]